MVSESPSIPFEPLVPLVPASPPAAPAGANTRCVSGLLETYMGRTAKITAAIGAKGEIIEKAGTLVFANHSHIAIREDGGGSLLVFNLDAVKIIEVLNAY